MENIKLSILVPTYNHEKYIKQCIDGILIQKTDFEYEVLIGEDCSTDGTVSVLKELEKDLPDNYHILYRETNMGDRGVNNLNDLIARAKGEYIAILEGDDYWTYEYKLAKQVEFLDSHPDYVAVTHNCVVVDENSDIKDEVYPECGSQDYGFKEFLNRKLPGQTATIVYRNLYYQVVFSFKDNYKLYESYPGDQLKAFLFCTLGKVRCIQEQWSAYRHVTAGGSSFSATSVFDAVAKKNEWLFFKSILNYSKSIHNKEAIITAGKLYYGAYIKRSMDRSGTAKFSGYIKEVFSEKYCITFLGRSVKSLFEVIQLKLKR